MTRDRRKGADDTSPAAAGDRAARLGAALRANLQRRKARARTIAADEAGAHGADAGTPRDPAAED